MMIANLDSKTKSPEALSLEQLVAPNYTEAEQQFIQLLNLDDLDQQIKQQPALAKLFEAELLRALGVAYTDAADTDARLFLHRILYRINRLNLFWYDDLQHYKNERSYYLQQVRDRIESVWQEWEISHFDTDAYQQLNVEQELTQRAEIDLNPPLTENKRYLRDALTLEGYRLLLAIVSLDGLVEASRMSRILGGASNEVQAMLIRVLMEEYGNGRFNRKHSTFFAQMMKEVNLKTEPEAYFDLAPWELLASVNHNFLLTERKRHFLRYNGGLTYFEIVGPSIYRDYMAAAGRLELSDSAMGYWELHIREDERHGQWMLQEVAFPLAKMYTANAWELLLGYDQEKLIGDRAGIAVINTIQMAEQSGNKVV